MPKNIMIDAEVKPIGYPYDKKYPKPFRFAQYCEVDVMIVNSLS